MVRGRQSLPSSAGKLLETRKWWDVLCQAGPEYGYHPLASETVLIVKPQHQEMAEEVFGCSGVEVTTDGQRHMGVVIGNEEFKELYVKRKVQKWVKDVEELVLQKTSHRQSTLI